MFQYMTMSKVYVEVHDLPSVRDVFGGALVMVNFIRVLSNGLILGTILRSLNRFRRNGFVMFSLLCLFIGLSISEDHQQANGQLIPIPPPAPTQPPKATHFNLGPNQVNSSISSPTIQFLTNSLIEGGNVFRVKITDKSDIKIAEITYVQNDQIVTQGLVRDPNNIYKALIAVPLPSAVIVINAVDTYGRTASVVKVLDVTPLPNSIFGQITNFFFGVGKNIMSIFGSAKQ